MSTHQSRRGFTLIEMIVSLGLFTVTMVVLLGAYLALINLDRRARTQNDLATNLAFAVDVMERSVRTGTNFRCGGGTNCWPYGAQTLTLTDETGQTIDYKIITDGAHSEVGQCINGVCAPITDPRITITNLNFYVRGVGTGDEQQPYVTFAITGSMQPDSLIGSQSFSIESSGNQRIIDL